MNKLLFIKMSLLITLLSGIAGCGYKEGDYEVITEKELVEAGIDVPFPPGWDGYRDADGIRINPNDILRDEGYTIELVFGEIKEVKKGDKVFKFSTQQKWTYLFDEYFVMLDGNLGIEDGFFRYFLRPIYSRLNTFDRETFDLIDQKIIHGVVRGIIIIDEYVYFHVADYRDDGFYGRYKFAE